MIPKLGRKKEAAQQSHSVSPAEYNSLSDLVNSHLSVSPKVAENPIQISKFSIKKLSDVTNKHNEANTTKNFVTRLGNKPLFPKKQPITKQVDIKSISDQIENLNVSNHKQTSTRSCTALPSDDSVNNKNNWSVDLSKALKATNSLPEVSYQKLADKIDDFEIPYTECDLSPVKETKTKTITYKCFLDISDKVQTARRVLYSKGTSRFGKALCRSYKRSVPYIDFKHKLIPKNNYEFFQFNTISPDDYIISTLNEAS